DQIADPRSEKTHTHDTPTWTLAQKKTRCPFADYNSGRPGHNAYSMPVSAAGKGREREVVLTRSFFAERRAVCLQTIPRCGIIALLVALSHQTIRAAASKDKKGTPVLSMAGRHAAVVDEEKLPQGIH